jgi:hypothetical protein
MLCFEGANGRGSYSKVTCMRECLRSLETSVIIFMVVEKENLLTRQGSDKNDGGRQFHPATWKTIRCLRS